MRHLDLLGWNHMVGNCAHMKYAFIESIEYFKMYKQSFIGTMWIITMVYVSHKSISAPSCAWKNWWRVVFSLIWATVSLNRGESLDWLQMLKDWIKHSSLPLAETKPHPNKLYGPSLNIFYSQVLGSSKKASISQVSLFVKNTEICSATHSKYNSINEESRHENSF